MEYGLNIVKREICLCLSKIDEWKRNLITDIINSVAKLDF